MPKSVDQNVDINEVLSFLADNFIVLFQDKYLLKINLMIDTFLMTQTNLSPAPRHVTTDPPITSRSPD